MRHGGVLGSGGALSPVKQDGRSTTPGLYYYGDAPGLTGVAAGESTSEHRVDALARHSSLASDERPPAFTPGAYRDPVLEKVHAAAMMREQYFRRESLATMALVEEAAGLDERGDGLERGYSATRSTTEKEKYT